MSTEYQLEYIVTNADLLRTLCWSICTPCMELKQSTAMPYNLCGNSTYEKFNHTLYHLLKTLDKEQKANWPLHLSSLVFAYNATLHSVTGYQPYEIMFGHKAPAVCNAWLGLAKYNDQYSQSKSTWFNEQHELSLAAHR